MPPMPNMMVGPNVPSFMLPIMTSFPQSLNSPTWIPWIFASGLYFRQLAMISFHALRTAASSFTFPYSALIPLLVVCSQTLSNQPPMMGDNIIVITNGGGIGVLATDAAEFAGVPLKPVPDALRDEFYKIMPSFGSPKNPIDITGGTGAKGYEDAMEIAMKSDWGHAIAVLYCETAVTNPRAIADAILAGMKKVPGKKKPVVCTFVGGAQCVDAGHYLLQSKVPMFDNPKSCMLGLSALRQYGRFTTRSNDVFTPFPDTEGSKAKAMAVIHGCRADGRHEMTEPEARAVLRAYNLPVPAAKLARTEDEAVAVAKEIGMPVVCKIVSPQILHKSDAGGVKVNVKDEAAVRKAWKDIMASCLKYKPDANIHGIQVGEFSDWGKEVIIGSMNDGTFGPTIMFGMGGIFVEVLKDVTWRVAPFPPAVALEMMPETKSYPILAGVRGEGPRDVAALAVVLSRMSQLVWELRDEIAEVDANPIIVYPAGTGVKAVDARIILTGPKKAAPTPAHH
eukprot:TRINITY_DN241_c0_g1_i35.p2 TRINITY_DN241_c0_g1~~TRINITY_DN241_c0_g1_i35.p2  ORF type:complete len:508 (+),score=136.99 TRINITY_DN241_c0_g1_i35:470-1993(+)